MKAKYIIVVGLAVLAAACSSPKPAAAPSTSTSTTVSPTSTSTTVSPTSTSTTVGPTSTTAPTTTDPSTTAAQQYLAAGSVAVVDYKTWKAAIASDTKVSQAIGPCTTYAAELTTFDDAISRIAVTGKVATDIKALVSDDRVVIKELDSVSTQTVASLVKEAPQLKANGRKAIEAGDVVRSDLGLPPS